MHTKSFIADVTHVDGADSFKVDRLTTAATNDPAEDLLDPRVMYADRDALQMVIAGKLCVEFPAVQIRFEEIH